MKSAGVKLSISQAGSSKSTSRANSNQVKYEGSQSDSVKSSTPTHSRGLLSQLYSPILSQTALEQNENLDVVWDWHSPQAKNIRKQKRLDGKKPPKLLIKKYPSNSNITEFDVLNQELKSLKDGIVENVETKDNKNALFDSNLDSVFNDSMEAELLVCSQKVEQKFLESEFDSKSKVVSVQIEMKAPEQISTANLQSFNSMQPVHNLSSTESNSINNNCVVKSVTSIKTGTPNKLADDSFEIALQALGDEDIEISYNNPQNNKKIKTSPNSLEKEEITSSTSTSSMTQCTLEEIENKRKRALEKLQKKKPSSCETSPLKCSQEEIEKKRLQAIAKLEAKKKQDLIEKNRREALKRLELNKKKRRALQFLESGHPIKTISLKK